VFFVVIVTPLLWVNPTKKSHEKWLESRRGLCAGPLRSTKNHENGCTPWLRKEIQKANCLCLVREIIHCYVKVKLSRYGPGVAQRVGRGIALLFYDRGTRRGWVVSSTPRPQFTPGKDPAPILQEARWAPGPVWTDGKSRPHRNSIPDRPARSQSLYWLSYPAHYIVTCLAKY